MVRWAQWATSSRDQQSVTLGALQNPGQRLRRLRVGPLEVVDQDQHRRGVRDPVDQPPNVLGDLERNRPRIDRNGERPLLDERVRGAQQVLDPLQTDDVKPTRPGTDLAEQRALALARVPLHPEQVRPAGGSARDGPIDQFDLIGRPPHPIAAYRAPALHARAGRTADALGRSFVPTAARTVRMIVTIVLTVGSRAAETPTRTSAVAVRTITTRRYCKMSQNGCPVRTHPEEPQQRGCRRLRRPGFGVSVVGVL